MRPCCVPENLRERGRLRRLLRRLLQPKRADVRVRQCGVCGARHFEVALEPGDVSMTGAPVGR